MADTTERPDPRDLGVSFPAGGAGRSSTATTSQALGAAMLVHDLRDPSSPANPEVGLRHPQEAFMFAANPGGRWRTPFDPSSAMPVLQRIDALPMVGSH